MMADERRQAARGWLTALLPNAATKWPGDPGTLARLRRAPSSIAALTEAETLRLWKLLEGRRDQLSRIGSTARVLAHVRNIASPARRRGALARTLGPGTFGDYETAKLKRLRFERLLATREEEDLTRAMIRLVQLAGREAPIDPGDLAVSILDWDDERTRIDWALAYHDPDRMPVESAVAAEAA